MGDDFHRTTMGHRFYEVDVPRIARALEKISKQLDSVIQPNIMPPPGKVAPEPFDPVHSPGMTDLMVPPEEIDAEEIYVCKECGSEDVEETAWVKVNGKKVVGGDGPSDEVWCPICQFHMDWGGLELKSEYLRRKRT
jgi:hypothetical protein